jgi:antitoxin component YwqK of YwqJK toxin-antitoxin module
MRLLEILKINYTLKLVISGLLISWITFAQGENPFVYSVISDGNGRVSQYYIVYQEISIKINPHITYVWHRNGQLRSTKGDYSGNILHGSYQEFDKSGKMLEKGVYYYGTKDGEWKSWNRNGEIIKVETWNRGFLKKRLNYDLSKCIVENYKQNKLDGPRIIFNNNHKDSVEHYRKGVLIVKNKRSFKTIFNHKKQKKASDVVNDK